MRLLSKTTAILFLLTLAEVTLHHSYSSPISKSGESLRAKTFAQGNIYIENIPLKRLRESSSLAQSNIYIENIPLAKRMKENHIKRDKDKERKRHLIQNRVVGLSKWNGKLKRLTNDQKKMLMFWISRYPNAVSIVCKKPKKGGKKLKMLAQGLGDARMLRTAVMASRAPKLHLSDLQDPRVMRRFGGWLRAKYVSKNAPKNEFRQLKLRLLQLQKVEKRELREGFLSEISRKDYTEMAKVLDKILTLKLKSGKMTKKQVYTLRKLIKAQDSQTQHRHTSGSPVVVLALELSGMGL